MKKLLSIVSVGALTCASVMATINWASGSIVDLAKGATVTASSNQDTAASIVDDNDGTGWQANAATHEFTHDWVMIDLGEKKTFTDIEIVWEASHCKEYSVYVSDEPVPYTSSDPAYNLINATWLADHTPVITGGNDTEAGYTENLVLNEPQTAQYVLIYADEYNNFGSQYGMRIFEVRIANIEGRDEVAGLDITSEGNLVAGGDAVKVTVTPLNKVGDALAANTITDLQLTASDPSVTIEGGDNGEFSVSASAYGEFTLTATAMADGTQVKGETKMMAAYNWDGIANIATGKEIQGRVLSGVEELNPPANAVDGNLETYYQYNGEWGGGDGWLLVDLGDVYMVDAIGAYYSTNAAGKCVFGYATDAAAIEAKIAADGTDFVWNAGLADVNADWTFTSELTRTADAITTYVYPQAVIARYIVVKDADNPAGKPCVNEIYVSGTKREAPKAAAIDITLEKDGMVIGETNTVAASVVDQYGDPMTADVAITVTGAEYNEGVITANAKGMVTVKAAADGIESEAKFFVADENDYCLDGAVITASEGAESNTVPVTDGGKVITNEGLPFQLAINEDAGAHEHWVLLKLAKPYNLDLIAVLWEGACPADYDVYLGETEESLQLAYSQKDKEGLKNYNDRFSGKEMNNIQYIKVVTTKNATGYGLKLYDIKVYGTSAVESVADKIEVSTSDNYIVTNAEVTLSAVVYDQFGAVMPDQEVTFICENTESASLVGDVFKASTMGEYVVKAACGDIEGETIIYVAANSELKFAPDMLPATVTLDGVDVTQTLFDPDVRQGLTIQTVPATLVIEFAEPHNFSLLDICWEAACPSDYTVVATYQDNKEATVLTVADRKFVGGVTPVDKIVNSSVAALSMETVGTASLSNVKKLTFNITKKDHDYPVWLYGINAYSADKLPSAVIDNVMDNEGLVDVYSLQGVKVRSNVETSNALEGLPEGIYIVGSRKVMH